MGDSLLIGLVAAAMAVGVVGTLVPVVPGLILVWAASLVYGLVGGFGGVGALAFAIITGLALAGIVVGVLLPQRAAARGGASRSSMCVGALIALVGFFVVPVIGVVLGGALGVFFGRVRTYSRLRRHVARHRDHCEGVRDRCCGPALSWCCHGGAMGALGRVRMKRS